MSYNIFPLSVSIEFRRGRVRIHELVNSLLIDTFFLIIWLMRKPSFEQFEATSLYCPKCKAAVPVRKKLLLVLPEGDEYEYLCAYCSSSVGTKIEKDAPQVQFILKP